MARYTLHLLLLAALFLLIPPTLFPESSLCADAGALSQSAHGDPTRVLKGCGSCHVGHGKSGTPMLPETEEEAVCCQCHGGEAKSLQSKEKGKLAGWIHLDDICREFEKPFHHPIEKRGIHQPGEILPEMNPSRPRHVECQDCHAPHQVERRMDTPFRRGTAKKETSFRDLSFEYQLCYRCHSYSANLPSDQMNKQQEFDLGNSSYHPVEGPGRNPDVPSLLPPYGTSSVINCTDCHGNNDAGGPTGPHGSLYDAILAKNYHRYDGLPESRSAYDLCYTCHNRNSILGNESFPVHYRHVVDSRISCYSCHDSHGSVRNSHLIRFNKDPRFTRVEPLPPTAGVNAGRIEYEDRGRFSGNCSLRCHGIDHNPKGY